MLVKTLRPSHQSRPPPFHGIVSVVPLPHGQPGPCTQSIFLEQIVFIEDDLCWSSMEMRRSIQGRKAPIPRYWTHCDSLGGSWVKTPFNQEYQG